MIDFYFGIIFNITSLIIFILGMYFHYKIIISRQIYYPKIIKNECFESDIIGKFYSLIYNREDSVHVGPEIDIKPIKPNEPIHRKKNLPREFITN